MIKVIEQSGFGYLVKETFEGKVEMYEREGYKISSTLIGETGGKDSCGNKTFYYKAILVKD